MSEDKSYQVSGIVTAFAIGAVVGAGLALLYAPQSGKATRDLLARKTREMKEKAGDAMDNARDVVRGKKEQILAAVKAGKDAMKDDGTSSPNAI